MSITERPPAEPRAAHRSTVHLRGGTWRPSPWSSLVAVSGLLLLAALGIVGTWWALSSETRITSYRVVGDLGRIELDLATADVMIDGEAVARWRCAARTASPSGMTRRSAGQ